MSTSLGDNRSSRRSRNKQQRRDERFDRRAERQLERKSAARQAARPAFPERPASYQKFRGSVAHALWQEASTNLPRGKMRRAFKRRAKRISSCGTAIRVRACVSCGDCRPGTGVLGSYDARCESRTCPVCARARSAGVREWLGRALDRSRERMVEALGHDDGRRWKHITMTLARDASDPEAHTWQMLRARIRALQAGWRNVWKSWKRIPGAAALLTIEIAGSGHVHAHALVLGPKSVAKQWISAEIGAAARHCSDSENPFVDIRSVDHKTAIGELAKYHAKVPGILTERWLAGHNVSCMHPVLAARWEIACYSQRLRERFGSLREIPLDETARHGDQVILSAEERAEADSLDHCEQCGGTEGWQWVHWSDSIQSWVGYCWSRGGDAVARPMERSELARAGPSLTVAVAEKDDGRLVSTHKRARTRAWWATRRAASKRCR